jgi:hypothetical protein
MSKSVAEFKKCPKEEIFVRAFGSDISCKCRKAHPDAGCFIVFNYITRPFGCKAYSLAEESGEFETLRKSGAEWEAIVARAARSQGRITIYVMHTYDCDTGRYWVLLLRSTTGEVYERLARIAAEPAGGEALNASEYGAWDLKPIHQLGWFLYTN